jgi:hypothetical protein
MRATCLALLIRFDFIIRIILVKATGYEAPHDAALYILVSLPSHQQLVLTLFQSAHCPQDDSPSFTPIQNKT